MDLYEASVDRFFYFKKEKNTMQTNYYFIKLNPIKIVVYLNTLLLICNL